MDGVSMSGCFLVARLDYVLYSLVSGFRYDSDSLDRDGLTNECTN